MTGVLEARHDAGMFRDRAEAGDRLATALLERAFPRPLVVLAIPRGGVIVAAPVARRLRAPLDVVVPHKLGAPDNAELAIGAVAPGVQVLDRRMIHLLGVSETYLDREVVAQEREIERRTAMYREGRPVAPLDGSTGVVVDDGVATGSTAIAALRWARAAGAEHVVFAAPVGPPNAARLLAADADEVVILELPDRFRAVGEWYESFDQVTDREVLAVLQGDG